MMNRGMNDVVNATLFVELNHLIPVDSELSHF